MANEKWQINPWHIASSVVAFISVISYFNINSAWADKIGQPKGNTIFLVVGIVGTLLAIGLMIKASKTSTGTGG